MGSRFQHISAHDALTLLRHSFSIPKLRYLLRTAPCFLSSLLEDYDHTLRTILSSVTNTPLLHNDRAWLQAVLPVKSGGLGVRRAADLAPAAYLASTYSTANLVSAILGQHSSSQPLPPAPFSDSAVEKWSHGLDIAPPVDHGVLKEKNWDTLRTSSMAESLLGSSVDATERARLLAAMDKNSGAWLQALPISSIGLRLDNPSLRIAVGLRLGTAICAPHHCQFCGAEVSSLGLHGLCCRKSEGRHSRNASLNDIIKRSLSTAGISSRLEPPGLSCSDGQRPDGMTLVPWSSGHPLVWDATCPDTFASSYEGWRCCIPGRRKEVCQVCTSGTSVYYTACRHRDLRRYRALYPIFSREVRQTHPLGHGRPPLYTVPPSAAVSSGTTGKYGSNFRQYRQLTYSSYLINKFTIILYLLIIIITI